MKRVCIFAALILCATILSCGGDSVGPDAGEIQSADTGDTESVEVDDLPKVTADIREKYRDTIILMWDEETLPQADRGLVVVVGRYLYETSMESAEALTESLVKDLGSPGGEDPQRTDRLTRWLDDLESGSDWHDADKLIFQDTLSEVRNHLETLRPHTPKSKGLMTRIDEDLRALEQIQGIYEKELGKIFDRLETRGMEIKREKWEDYLTFLRRGRTAAGVMSENRARVEGAMSISTRGGTVGAAGAGEADGGVDGAPLKRMEINGSELPDKTVILTFDDGPHSKHTPAVLDILDSRNVKAMFFAVGRSVGKMKGGKRKLLSRAEIITRISASGHLLGNHTYTHPVLTKLKMEEAKEELRQASGMLGAAAEGSPVMFRPPYGAVNKKIKKAAAALGMHTVMWNLDSGDWADPVPRSIANRAIRQVERKGRGVIVFHDIHSHTVKALPTVIDTLLEKGYRFVLWDGEKLLDPAAGRQPEVVGAGEPNVSRLYGNSHAVVIGINAYRSWPRLNYAVNDAKAMAGLLVDQFGFEKKNVHLLLDEDATRERIMEMLSGTLSDQGGVAADDRVVVFFAGHGATRSLPSGKSLGYIIPVDAEQNAFYGRAISMTTLQDINEASPAKHMLYLMDACYGGQALLRGGSGGHAPDKYIREITRRRTRQVLTAGGADEQVSDNGPAGHSIFTWTVLEGLRGKADLNGDQHITATELFAHVGPIVSSLSNQTPAFGSLVGSEGGEMVFELATDDEFLTDLSGQLDEEAIAINTQIEELRKQIADKLTRNDSLKTELAAVQAQLDVMKVRGGTAASSKSARNKAPTLRQLGMSLFREKRYAEAVKAYEDSLILQPDNALAANNLGFTYFTMGRLDEAMKWYRRTLEIDPERAVAHFNVAQVHERRGDMKSAVGAYRKFLKLAPDHKLANRVIGKLELLEGKK